MADRIAELYQIASKKGVLAEGLTEDMFREQTKTDEGLRSFYDYASQNGMNLTEWPTFRGKARGEIMDDLPQQPQQPAQPSSAQPAQQQRNVSATSANQTFSGGQYAFMPAAARANQQQVEQEESKRQALQRQAAATLPTTQQDRQTAAEIQRLGAEATWGKPNGVSFGIDPKTGLPTITKTEGNGVHLYTGEKLANQDQIDQMRANQPEYMKRPNDTEEHIIQNIQDAWTTNTEEGRQARVELEQGHDALIKELQGVFDATERGKEINTRYSNEYQQAFNAVYGRRYEQDKKRLLAQYQSAFDQSDENKQIIAQYQNGTLTEAQANAKLNEAFQRQFGQRYQQEASAIWEKYNNEFSETDKAKDINARHNDEYNRAFAEDMDGTYKDQMSGLAQAFNEKMMAANGDFYEGRMREMKHNVANKMIENTAKFGAKVFKPEKVTANGYMSSVGSHNPYPDAHDEYKSAYQNFLYKAEQRMNDMSIDKYQFGDFSKNVAYDLGGILESTMSFGLSDWRDRKVLTSIFEKVNAAAEGAKAAGKDPQEIFDNPSSVLNDKERAVYDAYCTYLAADIARQTDTSYLADAAKLTADMIPFMVEVGAMNGIFGGLNRATQNAITRGMARSIVNKLPRGFMRTAARGLTGLTVNLVGAGLYAAESGAMALVLPRTYANMLQNKIDVADKPGAITLNKDRLVINDFDVNSTSDAFFKAWRDEWKELFTETGGVFQVGRGVVFKNPIAKQVSRKVNQTSLGKLIDTFSSGRYFELAKQMGYHGTYQEWTEEVEGTCWDYVFGDKDAFDKFFSEKTQIPMLISFSIPSVLGGGINAARELSYRREYKKATDNVLGLLQKYGYSMEDIDGIKQNLYTINVEDIPTEVMKMASMLTNADEFGEKYGEYTRLKLKERNLALSDTEKAQLAALHKDLFETANAATADTKVLATELTKLAYSEVALASIDRDIAHERSHAIEEMRQYYRDEKAEKEQQPQQQPQDRQAQLRQQAAQQAQQEVQGMTHQDGNVYYVGIKGKDGSEGYAVSGNLNMQQDDKGMYSTSGRDIVTVKMNDGSVQQVPADELVVRDLPVSANELMQERTDHYFAQYANEDLFHVGDKVYLKQNGQQSAESSTIVGINDEGIEVEIIGPDNMPNTTVIPHEQAAEALAVAEGETEDNIVTYNVNGNELRLRDLGNGTYETLDAEEGAAPHRFTDADLAQLGAQRVEQPVSGQPPMRGAQPPLQQAPMQNPTQQAPMQPVSATPQQPQFGSNAPGIDELSAEDFAAQTVSFMQSPKVAQGYLTAERAKVNAQLQQLEKEGVTEYNSAEEYRTKAQQLEQSKARLQAQLEKIDGAIAAINAQAEAAVARKNLNEAIRKRAAEFSKQLGANIVIFDSLEQIPESQALARQAYEKVGDDLDAWYDETTGDIYMNANAYEDMQMFEQKVFHEVVSHKGLDQLLGTTKYNILCDAVWNGMSEASRNQYIAYARATHIRGSEKEFQRIAAKEYIAFLSEKRAALELNDQSEEANTIRSEWAKICEFLKDLFSKIFGNVQITDEDLAKLVHASFVNMQRQAQGITEEQGETNGVEAIFKPIMDAVAQWQGQPLLKDIDPKKIGMSALNPDYARNKIRQIQELLNKPEKTAEDVAAIDGILGELYGALNTLIGSRQGGNENNNAESLINDIALQIAKSGAISQELLDSYVNEFAAAHNEEVNYGNNGMDSYIGGNSMWMRSALDRESGNTHEAEKAEKKRRKEEAAAAAAAQKKITEEQQAVIDQLSQESAVGTTFVDGKSTYTITGVAHEDESGNLVVPVHVEKNGKTRDFEEDAVVISNKMLKAKPSAPVKQETKEPEDHTAAEFLNEALTETAKGNVPANVTIDETTIRDEEDSVEMDARLLIDGKPSNLSVTIFDQSLGSRGGYDPANLVKYYPFDNADNWSWEKADVLVNFFNKGEHSGKASVLDESDAVYFTSLQAAMEFAEFVNSEAANSPEVRLALAEAETDPNPTEAQKKAENYKQGHVTLWGLPITIENPKGSIRRGTDANGKQWEQEMHHTYGKIRRTEGVDGDHIDVFIGPNLTSDKVFVVDQRNVDTGEFDEHKCMLGFDSLEEAQNGYLSNYEEGWQGMGTVTEVTMDEFKKWIDSSHRKTKPFAEYKSVKTESGQSQEQAPEAQVDQTPEVQEPQEPEKIVPERPNSKQLQGMSYSVAEAEDYIGRVARNILDENGYEDVEIVGIKVIGSRVNGNAREDSDLDAIVEFKGNAREDALFNLFADENIELDGIKVDINPITEGKSGTIEQFMRRSDEYLAEKAATQALYDALAQAEAETDTNPTEAQKKAENYKQGHVTLWGLPITIENPKGSIRRGTDANGKQWEQEMHRTYGKIRRTEGVDGDHIDVFIGPNLTSDKVFVVDQRNVDTGEFDEHKCMLGFDSLEDAQNGYLSNYEEGWQGMGPVTEVTMDEFKKWIDSSHRKTKPFAEYKSVKTEGAASTAMEQAPTENRPTSETPSENQTPLEAAQKRKAAREAAKAAEQAAQQQGESEMLTRLRELQEGEDQQAPQDYLHSLTDEQLEVLDKEVNELWNKARTENNLRDLNDQQIREQYPEAWKTLLLRNRVSAENSRRYDMQTTEESIANRKAHTESEELRRYYEYEFAYMRASASKGDVLKAVHDAEEYLAGLSYEELAKIYNEIVRLQSEYDVPWILTNAYRARSANMENEGVFDYGLNHQGEIPEGKANKPKINASDWTAKDDLRPVMNGVYHDPSGVGVVTNAHILMATPSLYDPAQDGKIVKKDGSTVDGQFPNWQGVVDQARRINKKEATVDWTAIRNFIAGIKAKMKEEGNPLKKDSLANIIIRMPDGQVIIYRLNMFIPFADAAAAVGANTLHYSPINGQTLAEVGDSHLVIMPVDPESFRKNLDWGYKDNFYYDLQPKQDEPVSAETPKTESKPERKPKPTRKKAAPAEQTQAPVETDAEVIEAQKPKNTDKIEDVGEKIGGARKDIIQDTVDRINVNGDTFAKIFPKFDYHKLIANGLEPRLAAGLKYVCEHAKKSYKIRKKRFGEKNALEATRFMANYAKGYLLGDTSLDFTSEGWVFTAYGKRRYEFGIKLWESLREAMGDTMFDVDLSGYDCDVIQSEEERKAEAEEKGRTYRPSSSIYYRRNADGESVEFTPRYAINTPKGDKLFTAEEYDQAVQYFQDQVTSAINYQAANPFELAIYRKRGSDDCCVHAKIGGKWVELTPWGKEYGLKYRDEHRAELQAMAQRKAEELKEQRKNTRPEAKVEVKWFSGVEDVGSYRIATKIGKEYVPISEPMPVKDIWKYAREHHDELQAKAQELLNAYLDEQEANRGWKPQLNIGGLRNRVGTDWRNGADVTAERFRTEFGFRGVEFGNYVTQKERQRLLNECFDALHDMAEILGVSPRALSLNGQLGFAIGARGGAGAKAHYEPGKNVINLTKKNGWGALAHEWWHAMDYYFGKREKERPATSGIFRDDVRKQMQDAFAAVMKAINGSEYLKRSQNLDAKTNKRYYAEDTELGARAFEDYIAKQLIARGQVNDFLSHHTAEEDWNGDISNYPYPIEKDGTALADAFQSFFDTVEEQEDASTGNSVLFSVTDKKYAQFALTQANNPMLDDVHTGIRSVEDIHTLEETLNDDKLLVTEPDWEEEDIRRAIEDNQVTIYSSKPIQDGTFVTPSRMVAEDYAGGEMVYEKTVSPDKVAWIASDEGQYADTDHYDGNILFSITNANNEIFYSNAERAVEGIKQDKATPEQWRAMIEKAGGLKAGEDKWIGLSEWLSQQRPIIESYPDETPLQFAQRAQAERKKFTISKQEILHYIRANKIQIEETEYGETTPENNPTFRAFQDEVTEMWDNVNRMQNGRFNDAVKDIIRYEDELEAKYGEDFRDMMDDSERNTMNYLQERRDEINMEVFLPEQVVMEEMCNRHGDDFQLAFSIDDDGSLSIANEDAAGYYLDVNPINDTRLQYTTEGLTNKHEIAMTVPTIEPWNEDDEIHFGDAGEGKVVAWARFGDATDEQGNKTLVIDEIQSKRHQEGREYGYVDSETAIKYRQLEKEVSKAQLEYHNYRQQLWKKYENQVRTRGEMLDVLTPEEKSKHTELQEKYENLYDRWEEFKKNTPANAIPAAPFEKNWHELAMKRILRYAAENGYDKVAWTTGDQQAARYNIGEVIDSITRNEDEDYPYSYSVMSKDHGELEYDFEENGIYHDDGDPELDGKSMSDVFGKELAKRLQEMPAGETIDNEGLRIGGEGMRGFYDDILPRFMQKYGKKWGVQVGEVTMPQLEDGYQTMHAIDINDAMRESVMEGQPMFSITPKNTSLDQVLFSIKVNHNSPFLLKKADGAFVDPATGERLGFDHRFMSAGEGGQAHGWGSYFSVNDLRNYAENHLVMGDSEEAKEEEERIYSAFDIPGLNNTPYFGIFDDPRNTIFRIVSAVNENKERPQSLKLWLEDKLKESKEIISSLPTYRQASGEDWYKKREAEFNETFIPVLLKYMKHDLDMRNRHHYDVEIPDNNGTNYIEEEQPLNKEQIERIRKANDELAQEDIFGHEYTRKYGRLYPFSDVKNFLLFAEKQPEQYPFRSFYGDLESFMGANMHPEYITKLLQRAGFDGIHYEGQRDGECYVIFNENDAKIVNHVMFSITPKAERIEKLLNSEPVVITGNEIAVSNVPAEQRRIVKEYIREHNLKGAYTNADTGSVIQVQYGRKNGGVMELLQHDFKNPEHIQSIAAIPQIIEKSIYIDSAKNWDKEKNPEVTEYQYFVCGLKIGDEDYTVRSSIAIDRHGNRYYDHKLTHMEKGKLLDLSGRVTNPARSQAVADNGSITNSERKDNTLFSILQINPEENAENLQNSSENADLESKSGENGEQTPKNTSLDQVLFSITVNHNSPYLLKRADGAFVDPETGERLGFDHRFMGKGEGSQAHGYGSYFSIRDLRDYADPRDGKYLYKGKAWNELWNEHENPEMDAASYVVQEMEYGKTAEEALASAIEDTEASVTFHRKSDIETGTDYAKGFERRLEALMKLDVNDFSEADRGRHHYTVEIPDNDGTNYLDEIKTLPKPLRRKIAAAVRELPGEPMPSVKYVNYTGGWRQLGDMIERNQWAYMEIRDRLVEAFGGYPIDSEKRLSKLMSSLGFVGVHYDGRRDGECYVIFNENDAKIVDHVMFSITEKDPLKRWEAANPRPEAKADETTIEFARRLQAWNNEHRKVKDAIKDAQPSYDHAEYDGVLFSTTPPFTGETIGDLYAGARQRSDLNRKRRESAAITDMLIKLSKDNYWRMQEALHKINADIKSLRRAMRLQSNLDKKQVEELLHLYQSLIESTSEWAKPGDMPETTGMIFKNIVESIGKEDITEQINNIMVYLSAAQRTAARNQWYKLRTTELKKLNISGVVTQGKVAVQGQHAIQALNEALSKESGLTLKDLVGDAETGDEGLIGRMMEEEDKATTESLKLEYKGKWIGYTLAAQHMERMEQLNSERKELLADLRAAENNEHLKPFVKAELIERLRQALVDNDIAKADAYMQSTTDLQDYVTMQTERAKNFLQHLEEWSRRIRNMAAEDLSGVQADPLGKDRKKSKVLADLSDWQFSTARDMQSLLRFLGRNTPDGKGALYNHYFYGYQRAADTEFKGIMEATDTMGKKVAEIFGKGYKTFEDVGKLCRQESKRLKLELKDVFDGVNNVDIPISVDNALYIYAVSKMDDGMDKLLAMNISREDVANLIKDIDPRLIELVDWVQNEFFVNLRNRYNPMHESLYGAPMDKIENYFPLRIARGSLQKNVDVAEDENDASRLLPGTSTGAIKRRTKNAKPLDILAAGFLTETVRHITQMEKWNAFAQWTRDTNILLSDIMFRERVKALNSYIYGENGDVYAALKKAMQMANGTYKSAKESGSTFTLNVAKGATSAKINFRVWTAMKQIASHPAVIPYLTNAAAWKEYGKIMVNPYQALYGARQWALETLPAFQKRISKRDMGDMRLMRRAGDWEWQRKILEASAKYGMFSNMYVDTLTCAHIAKVAYESTKADLLAKGYTEEQATEKALLEAEIAFNTSQQSSESGYMAPVQSDRTWNTVVHTVFRVSPIQYTREWLYYGRNIGRKMKKGAKERMVDSRMRFYMLDGLSREQAQKAAESDYRKALAKDIAGFTVYGWLMNAVWRLMAAVPYLLLGDDDDEKKKLIKRAMTWGFYASPITGLFWGGALESALDRGDVTELFDKEMPITSDIVKAARLIKGGKAAEVASASLNVLVQSTIGFDIAQFTENIADAVIAVKSDQDMSNFKKARLVAQSLMSVPKSQWEQVLIDKAVEDAPRQTNNAVAKSNYKKVYDKYLEDYIEYYSVHQAPLTFWARGEENEQKMRENAETKYRELLRERGIDKDVLPDTKASRDKKKRK